MQAPSGWSLIGALVQGWNQGWNPQRRSRLASPRSASRSPNPDRVLRPRCPRAESTLSAVGPARGIRGEMQTKARSQDRDGDVPLQKRTRALRCRAPRLIGVPPGTRPPCLQRVARRVGPTCAVRHSPRWWPSSWRVGSPRARLPTSATERSIGFRARTLRRRACARRSRLSESSSTFTWHTAATTNGAIFSANRCVVGGPRNLHEHD